MLWPHAVDAAGGVADISASRAVIEVPALDHDGPPPAAAAAAAAPSQPSSPPPPKAEGRLGAPGRHGLWPGTLILSAQL